MENIEIGIFQHSHTMSKF